MDGKSVLGSVGWLVTSGQIHGKFPRLGVGDPRPSHQGSFSLFLLLLEFLSCFFSDFISIFVRALSFMEDLGLGYMVDYSLDSMERIFAIMGELALVGSTFLGMELEQHLRSMVPSPVDRRVFVLTDGTAQRVAMTDQIHPVTTGEQFSEGIEPMTSLAREDRAGV